MWVDGGRLASAFIVTAPRPHAHGSDRHDAASGPGRPAPTCCRPRSSASCRRCCGSSPRASSGSPATCRGLDRAHDVAVLKAIGVRHLAPRLGAACHGSRDRAGCCSGRHRARRRPRADLPDGHRHRCLVMSGAARPRPHDRISCEYRGHTACRPNRPDGGALASLTVPLHSLASSSTSRAESLRHHRGHGLSATTGAALERVGPTCSSDLPMPHDPEVVGEGVGRIVVHELDRDARPNTLPPGEQVSVPTKVTLSPSG